MSNGTQAGQTIGQKVVIYASGKLGRTEGSGECYDLANAALAQANAKSAPDYGKITPDADYVWGDPVELAAVREGDILQFRNHKFTVKVTTRTRITPPVARRASAARAPRSRRPAMTGFRRCRRAAPPPRCSFPASRRN